MAKKSMIEKNKTRIGLSNLDLAKRKALKAVIMNMQIPIVERLQAQLKLAKMRRIGALSRGRNRCEVTGRPRGFHSRVKMSRIALREMASHGQIPGMTKASWLIGFIECLY